MFFGTVRYSITDGTKVFKHAGGMWGTPDYFFTLLAILLAIIVSAALALKMAGKVYRAHLESNTRRYNEMLEDANAQLRHAATHDALTGLPNRLLLADRLAQAMARAQ